MTRRDFITVPAKGVSAAVITALGASVLPAQQKNGATSEAYLKVPLRFFTRSQAALIEAACERIMPTDESGPGAKEAGVIIYIDRQLAGPYGHDKYRYTKPPFFESVPEHGYQGKENPRQIYTAGFDLLGADFASLAPEQQDAKLISIEHSLFFQMLRTHTIEGMFCDPLHGGNIGMVGWKMIGFPGPRMSWREDIDKHFGEAFRPAPKSLAQIVGHPVKGMEDEPV